MALVLLHLSDIHIKGKTDPILEKHEEIASCVFQYLHNAKHVVILVSGDVVFSGKESEYDLAMIFLEKIKKSILHESKLDISFVIVPGNHDCNFEVDSGARDLLVSSMCGSNPPQEIDNSIIDTCVSVQKSFFEFRKLLENEPESDDGLWRTQLIRVDGKLVSFEGLNISWVSQLKEKQGCLYFPVNKYQTAIQDECDLRLVVMHHPLNWFNQTVYRSFRTFIRKAGDIIVTGHEHQGAIGTIQEDESGKSAYIEGCVLQESSKGLKDSSFNVIVIDLDDNKFSSANFHWVESDYMKGVESDWRDYKNLPSKAKNSYLISDEALDILNDPGGFFKHPGCDSIQLSDIYIYPHMNKVGDRRRKSIVNSDILLSPDKIAGGVLIESEEKFGSTSLLYQLFKEYHDRGFVPVYVNGRDIKRKSDQKIDAAIRKSVVQQYGKGNVDSFLKLSASKKVLLLDDFDEGPMKASNARADLLVAFRKRFGHMVITVSNMFEVKEVIGGKVAREFMALEHYKLQAFGYMLRSKLIQRWFSLGADGTVDESTFIAQCDQAERLLDSVMTKTVIPSVPLYLLTLLQTMDAGRGGELKDSALGHYYHYLLTEGLRDSGVKDNKLTEVFRYCSYLAWEFFLQKKRELSILDLQDFNAKFSKDWVTVDLDTRLKILIDARVLYRVGEDYAFRYPYIFYYLKGNYMSDNMDADDVIEHISHCCDHLYVRDFANSILFLAHHSNDRSILDSVSSSLGRLFVNRKPICFVKDTSGLKSLVENAPSLSYTGETPSEHRDRRKVIQDELDTGHDGLADEEESAEIEGLSLIAQIMMLFKTSEILGQILKDQYSKINRPRKVGLLEDLFNAPLRAISDFYKFIEDNPDSLVAEIESALKRKESIKSDKERGRIAKSVVASLVQIVTFSFILKTAQAANSESLMEDIRTAVEKNNSLAYKLIEVCILLDSPKNLPRGKLKEVYKEAKDDFIAENLLKIMILNRLYMFKTSESDMQWLSNTLDLKIGVQHSISYHETKRRMLK